MSIVKTKTTYLEMHQPSPSVVRPPCHGIEVTEVDTPSTEFYRYLYRSVGEQFHWVDRLVMPVDELRAIIQDDRVEIYVLSVDGETAGYAELDRRQANEVELAYFGLFPQFVGQGLGKYFLDRTLRKAWSYSPQRVWVHTCDLDHPAALPTYVKAGFAVYDEKIIDQIIPDDMT